MGRLRRCALLAEATEDEKLYLVTPLELRQALSEVLKRPA
jgi:hypothetical protein